MQTEIKININKQSIRFKPTEFAKKHYYDWSVLYKHPICNLPVPSYIHEVELPIDMEGYTKLPLWEFIMIFGGEDFVKNSICEDDCIVIKDEDAD